jgi:type IV pilus biogenesis protein CpaD/CtpE
MTYVFKYGQYVMRALLSGIALAGCTDTPPSPTLGPKVDARAAFTVTLPSDCILEGGDQKLDFAILHVVCKGVPKIGIYAGNAANIDSNQQNFISKPDIPDRSIILAPDNAATIRGYLWKTHYDWPEQLHVWFIDGQENDATAQQIAASIHPTTPFSPASASRNN